MNTTAHFAVAPKISIDGHVHQELMERLVSLTVEQQMGRPACAVLRANNVGSRRAPYAFFDDGALAHGAQVTVVVADSVQIFDGRIDALGGVYPSGEPPALEIRAHDALDALRRRRVSRRFEDLTGLDVITQIAAVHDLPVNASSTGDVHHRHLTQANQSDLAFCRQLARDMDADLFVKDGRLEIQPRGASDPDPIELDYGRSLIRFSCEASLARQTTQVSVHGWDPQTKAPIVEADDGAGIAGEIGNDRSGFAVAQAAYGQRNLRVVHTVPLSTDAARASASARFGERARGFVSGRGLCDGDGRLRVGRGVKLEGLGPWFDGHYAVTATTHRFDAKDGYRTEFEAARPGIGRARRRRTDDRR